MSVGPGRLTLSDHGAHWLFRVRYPSKMYDEQLVIEKEDTHCLYCQLRFATKWLHLSGISLIAYATIFIRSRCFAFGIVIGIADLDRYFKFFFSLSLSFFFFFFLFSGVTQKNYSPFLPRKHHKSLFNNVALLLSFFNMHWLLACVLQWSRTQKQKQKQYIHQYMKKKKTFMLCNLIFNSFRSVRFSHVLYHTPLNHGCRRLFIICKQ